MNERLSRLLVVVGALALLVDTPLRSGAQEVSGQGEGYNPGTSSVRFVQTNVTMTYSNGRLTYPRAPLAEIVSNQTGETLRLTVAPVTTTGSWVGVVSSASLYSPTSAGVVLAEAADSASSSQSSSPLSSYVAGASSLNWSASGQGLAQLELSVGRTSGPLVAGTYQIMITLASVAS